MTRVNLLKAPPLLRLSGTHNVHAWIDSSRVLNSSLEFKMVWGILIFWSCML